MQTFARTVQTLHRVSLVDYIGKSLPKSRKSMVLGAQAELSGQPAIRLIRLHPPGTLVASESVSGVFRAL